MVHSCSKYLFMCQGLHVSEFILIWCSVHGDLTSLVILLKTTLRTHSKLDSLNVMGDLTSMVILLKTTLRTHPKLDSLNVMGCPFLFSATIPLLFIC
jgi:hypothetical protein